MFPDAVLALIIIQRKAMLSENKWEYSARIIKNEDQE